MFWLRRPATLSVNEEWPLSTIHTMANDMKPIIFLDMKCAPSRPLRLGYLQGPRYPLLLKRTRCCASKERLHGIESALGGDCVAFQKRAERLFKAPRNK